MDREIGTAPGRMRALLNQFEGKKEPPPPARERLQSTLDAPRAELSAEAKTARVQSISLVRMDSTDGQKIRRYVPKIGPTDSDEVRDLKRQIQAKDQEIVEMSSKLMDLADRLDRVVQIFNASLLQAAEAASEVTPAKSTSSPTKAFQSTANEPQPTTSRPRSSPSASGTSLEAILAAARGSGARVKSDKPKYSRMLRDMK